MTRKEPHYQRNPDYIYRRIVDELVLVPIHQDVADMDCIYTMNAVGGFLWEQLDEPTTQAELEAAMLDEYDADAETVASDLELFLQEMVSIGAIREV